MHVYFNASTLAQARSLCETIVNRWPDVQMGRMHEKIVGPHPDWSCQLGVRNESFLEVMSYLTMHRNGLTVFIHPITGQDTIDHRDRAIWMGSVRPLALEKLPDFGVKYDLLQS
ncbi:DOPA 4,5-dioxygenase family protein [Oceanobacter mangrovi]|uniref:DOPA 4,5-dioxygenase family protein n=1 Tax=Oceanobacter mangrovi TaxID=2862510 RepID=UPI001C8F0CAD|nr:DOPA 4,5-dioxygenase family protein [Oceanobacter mangrovi]